MIDDRVLMNDWHVVAWSKDIPEGKPVPVIITIELTFTLR